MNSKLVFNSSTLEYKDIEAEKIIKGQSYTMKSIITDFELKEIRRFMMNGTIMILYGHTFKATENMYISFYNLVMDNREVASSVVCHMVKPWELAKQGGYNPYASYSQNKFDIKMLELCLNDTLSLSKIHSIYSTEPFSVIVRLHSNNPGLSLGKFLVANIIVECRNFGLHPKYIWLEPMEYDREMIDKHMGILVDSYGISEELIKYYQSLGFNSIDVKQYKGNKELKLTLRELLSHPMVFNINSLESAQTHRYINRIKLDKHETKFKKHISKVDRQYLLANISEEQ